MARQQSNGVVGSQQTSMQPRYSVSHPRPLHGAPLPPPPRRRPHVVALAQPDAAAHASISVVHLPTHCSSSASPALGAAAATRPRQAAVGTHVAATRTTASVSHAHAASLPVATAIDGSRSVGAPT
jgi:hypothetical protein